MLKFFKVAKSKDEKLVNGSEDNGKAGDLDVGKNGCKNDGKVGWVFPSCLWGCGCSHTDG